MNRASNQFEFPSGQVLEIYQGDIKHEKTDAIVNAANAQLMHGGGVAAAIARAGGETIRQVSSEWIRKQGHVTHAHPAVTSGGNLPCKAVIHAVGPKWGEGAEDTKLAEAILGSLKTAEDLKMLSIAFPAISTGIYGFPKERAAKVFMRTIQSFFKDSPHSAIKVVRIVLMDETTLEEFSKAFQNMVESRR